MKSDANLILASGSPRRKSILKEVGFQFDTITKPVDESYPEDLPKHEVAEYLAKLKNQLFRKDLDDQVIITADTTVLCQHELLGKPENESDATRMLSLLSGNIHDVITGVCISNRTTNISFSDTTEVKFLKLSQEEIKHYILEQQPLDKAAAYGIQEWIGMIGVEWIKGSYYNVVGLPIHKVYSTLKEHFGFNLHL